MIVTRLSCSKDVKLKARIKDELQRAIKNAGFISDVEYTNAGFKIGLHMCSFRIDTDRHGFNKQERWHSNRWRKTALPTWEQRVEFNDIVNRVFDRFSVSCRIVSGPFVVRDKIDGARHEEDWHDDRPHWYRETVSPLTDDDISDRRAGRNAKARERRAAQKRQRAASLPGSFALHLVQGGCA